MNQDQPRLIEMLRSYRGWLQAQLHRHEEEMREHIRSELGLDELDDEDEGELLDNLVEADMEVESRLYNIEDMDIDEDPDVNFTYGGMWAFKDALERFDSQFGAFLGKKGE